LDQLINISSGHQEYAPQRGQVAPQHDEIPVSECRSDSLNSPQYNNDSNEDPTQETGQRERNLEFSPNLLSYGDFNSMPFLLPGADQGTDLLTLVQSYDWPGALARLSFHPNEAKSIGMQGRTPLHIACDLDAPLAVIQALIRAYPAAATMIGTSSMNPMHITVSCQHASVEVVRTILDESQNPKLVTSMKDLDGDTPLHAACRCGAPMDVLEVLLRSNPAVVHDRDFEGLTPLLRLWVRYYVILGDRIIENVNERADVKGELAEAWEKTELLLRASYCGCLDEICPSDLESERKNCCNSPSTAVNTIACPTVDVKRCCGNMIEEEYDIAAKCRCNSKDLNGIEECDCMIRNISTASLVQSHDVTEEHSKVPRMSDSVAAATAVTGVSDTLRKTEISGIEQVQILETRGSGASHVSSDLGTVLFHWRMPYMVHAAAHADCPRAVVKIATILYPDQLDQLDESGRNPLMIAAMAPVYKEHDLSDEGYCMDDFVHDEEENDNNHVASEDAVDLDDIDDGFEPNQPTVIQLLLEAGADATKGNFEIAQGRIPINLAIVSGKRWREGIQKLKRGYPDSLIRVDKETGLYPFMLAAAVGVGTLQKDAVKGRKGDLFTIFSLLRSRPEAIRVASEDLSDNDE
jgi:ankyrin repeat protein